MEKLNVELKNVQYSSRLSEESAAFAATVYIDGKLVGEVSNRGCGGDNEYHPWEIQERLNQIAKASLPVETYSGIEIEPNADILCGKLLDEHLLMQELRKALRTRLLWFRDGKVYQSNRLTPEVISNYCKTYRGDKGILLQMQSLEKALELYRKGAA